MPPARRARHADPTGTPYPDGWLSYRRRRRLRRPVQAIVRGDESGDVTIGGAHPSAITLPDDVLFGIFSRVPGFTDAARCAATCRRWARVVATRAASISRALPPPPPPPGGLFLPHLAIGVFLQHQEDSRCARAQPQLRFVPTAFAASRTLAQYTAGGGGGAHLVGEGGATFDDARPVASRNGRVVLQLGRKERANGLTLCVWNPMTGDVAMVPTLSGEEFPGDAYACAILTGDDLDDDDDDCSPGFFRLLLVYGRRGFTALRSFSSDTGRWGVECKKPGAKIGGHMLRQLGPAVVLHGVAYWHMHRAALGVRLSGTATAAATDTIDVCSVPYRDITSNCKLDEHVLGVSPDGRLNFVIIRIVGALGMPVVCFSTKLLEDAVAVGYKSTTSTTTSVDPRDDDEEIRIELPQIKVTRATPMKTWWFGEKSGTLIFTVEEETGSTSTVFALNVVTRSLEKLADGVTNHTCLRRIYGYEMDRAALLASVAQ